MVKYTEDQVLRLILDEYNGKKTYLLAPLVRNRKGHYKELFEQIRKKGYLNVRVDGELKEIFHGMKLDRYKMHSIEVVIDKMIVSEADERRLKESLKIAMKQGDGLVLILDAETNEVRHYSRRLMDPVTGLSYSEPAPHNFSFNSPQGACPKCKGLGQVNLLDMDKIVPDPSLSIYSGGIVALGKYKNSLIFWQIEALCQKHGVTIKTPIRDIPEEAMDEIMNGTDERLQIKNDSLGSSNYFLSYEGVAKYILMQQESEASASAQKWAGQFIKMATCPECNGWRLNKEALSYRIAGKNIAELSAMDISELYEWLEGIEEKLDPKQLRIATEILKEIRSRLRFLLDVGLDYLSMNRGSATLSGGESQRIRLATQIGSQLVNVLYILDEPSIGLHQRDNVRLINSLKQLRDTGNSVIVVEHDKDMMLSADYVVDMGPKAGRLGGEVVFEGTPKEMLRVDTLTSSYLNGNTEIAVPAERRKGNGQFITIKGASGNNLKHVDVSFPLGTLICVTGVSGSGKSTLINRTLQPILSQHFYHSLEDPLAYDVIEGIEHVDKIVNVDQSPIGRSPRSNPATYTGVFSDIRNLFVELPESKVRGYKPGRFSFNVSGGRCETCKGNGYKTIEMNFLPDVLVPCEDCHGKRYNRETLEVRFRGKSIADILDMTINMAVEFFENIPTILSKIKVLQDVGLGYIKLGQPSTTLSGGESQRVKLATELAKRDTGKTLYVLDEPTTGLHFEDIRVLLGVLNKLVDKGNTIIVIEHNLDVIKSADYLIDMGPEGGRRGGNVLFTGTPEALAKSGVGFTAPFLKEELDIANKKK
jgi:excinuclease ABC subunit A